MQKLQMLLSSSLSLEKSNMRSKSIPFEAVETAIKLKGY